MTEYKRVSKTFDMDGGTVEIPDSAICIDKDEIKSFTGGKIFVSYLVPVEGAL